jgi:hypothetical protein
MRQTNGRPCNTGGICVITRRNEDLFANQFKDDILYVQLKCAACDEPMGVPATLAVSVWLRAGTRVSVQASWLFSFFTFQGNLKNKNGRNIRLPGFNGIVLEILYPI